MDWNEELQAFTYECPCGDLFQISMEELEAGEEGAAVNLRDRDFGAGVTE